jgi:trimeric autotransporter adhesin
MWSVPVLIGAFRKFVDECDFELAEGEGVGYKLEMPRSLCKNVRVVLSCCLIVCLVFGGARKVMGESAKGSWDSRFTLPPGLNGSVYTMMPLGPLLVVGGDFTRAGSVQARGVAVWDGSRWWPLGGGVDGEVHALALSNDGLYVGGIFTHAGGVPVHNVAKWNGVSWDAMGGGAQTSNRFPAAVYALYLQQGSVYVGGAFTRIGNLQTPDIARWDGKAWHPLAEGVWYRPPADENSGTGFVEAITGDGVNVYVGGSFARAGSLAVTNLARWNGRSWDAVGNTWGGDIVYYGDQVNYYLGVVSSLTYYQNNLYVAGSFGAIGGVIARNFAWWDGRSWHGVSLDQEGGISVLKVEQGSLYAAGFFERIGGVAATNLAVLRNGAWSGIQADVPHWDSIRALAFTRNALYAGGDFTLFNGKQVGHIVKHEQGRWNPVGLEVPNSFDRDVVGVAVQGANVYAAGYFHLAGTNEVAGVARWNGTKWLSVGSSISGYGQRIAAIGNNVYVAGQFNFPDGSVASLVRWDGTNWSTLPVIEGDFGTFSQIIAVGKILYVSGNITFSALNETQPFSAGWDGTNWMQIPLETSSPYYSDKFATDQTNLYIARTDWDGVRVARWDGQAVQLIGETIPALQADALAVSGQQVYLAGEWPTNHKAAVFRWNGSQWSQISGLLKEDTGVTSMAVMNNKLYVGGVFDSIGGVRANNIAQWDGSRWRSLGSGVQDGDYGYTLIWDMLSSGGKLYLGGNFNSVDGKASGKIGIWTEGR